MKRNFVFVFMLIFLMVGGIIFFFLFPFKSNDKVDNKNILEKILKKRQDEQKQKDKNDIITKIGSKKLVFLVLGLDYNWVEGHRPTSKGARSDTIILVVLDLYSQQVRLMSIPRDLRVYYEDYGYYDKINSAITIGGPRLTKKIISELFSVHIDYIFIVKQLAIKNLVDSVGGVYIDVEKDMFYQDNWGNLNINLKKGRQLLNGEQVIGYMRFRMDEEGDLGRIRRQNQAITQIMQQLPSKINSSNIFNVVNNVLPYIETDLTRDKMILLVDFLSRFPMDYKSYRLPVKPLEIEGVSYVEQDGNYMDYVVAWYRGYEKLSILGACSQYNNKQIFDKYISDGKYLWVTSDYLDDYFKYSVIIHKGGEKSSLYYRLPFGKSMDLKEFLYNRYVCTSSEIYLSNRVLYDDEIKKIKRVYDDSDLVLILGEDSVEK